MIIKSLLRNLIKIVLPWQCRSLINQWVIYPVSSCYFRSEFRRKMVNIHAKYGNAILLMATPTHGNLGDQAIVMAEIKLLSDIGLGDRIIEISKENYCRNKEFIRRATTDEDIILIDGGGNLGTLWPLEDDKISEIIHAYCMNPVVIFPQTCFYSNNTTASIRLQQNNQIYARARKLIITLRDRDSFKLCMEEFPFVQMLCVPDVVLYLNSMNMLTETKRKGVLFCFREDLEKLIPHDEVENLKNDLLFRGLKCNSTSTIVPYAIRSSQRERELMAKWKEFSSTKLVITDRLHGMIFSIITGTPCLALDNVSRKVSGAYNLIPKVKYVKICNDLNEVKDSIENYSNLDHNLIQRMPIELAYTELKELIKKYI